ncbi:porphobilinogen synthase [Haloferula sp.]|uniref:porphobilinogen synthase n=1 Tax=Haloferula sp. TaxID=2497595 RepID=UPI00329AA410
MYIRPRRNRKTPAIRALISENTLSASDFIYPLFVHEGSEDQDIESMPGCKRWSLDGLLQEAGEAHALGIQAVVLFPAVGEKLKTPGAEESWNPDGLVPTAVRALKEAHPDLCVITDVALDPYNSDGHDGLVEEQADGSLEVLNDPTVLALCQQALCHAEAGADVVSPSDMMDGRVGAIRGELDDAGYQDVSILSYSAKYASAFYGPFRGALESAPKAGDKKTYQMDPANVREAIREVGLDEGEGADMIMVKPAGPYLDVISRVRETTVLPLAAYQVSGEYLMIESAAASGWVDGKAVALESLMGIKRAGADLILTYYAKRAAAWLK